MYTGLQVLRAKIRGLQAAGISIHNRIRKAKGPKRNKLWDEKRHLGGYNREHLIAYGLLRGIPYARIEKCSENNRPDPQRVFELVQAHADWKAKREFTLEKVKELLSPTAATPPQQPTSAPQATDESLLARAKRLLEKRVAP